MLKNISYLLAGCICLYSCNEKQQPTEKSELYNHVGEVPDIIRLGYKGPIKSITSEISYLWQTGGESEVLIDSFDKKGKIISQLNINTDDTSIATYVYENNRLYKVLLYDSQKRLTNIRFMLWETPYKYTLYYTEQDTVNWFCKIHVHTNVFFIDSFISTEFRAREHNKTDLSYCYYDTDRNLKKHTTYGKDTSNFEHIYVLKDNYGNPGKEYIINDRTNDTTIIKRGFEYYE